MHRHEDLVKTNPYHTDALKVAIQHTTKESDKTRRQTELTAKTGQDGMAIAQQQHGQMNKKHIRQTTFRRLKISTLT